MGFLIIQKYQFVEENSVGEANDEITYFLLLYTFLNILILSLIKRVTFTESLIGTEYYGGNCAEYGDYKLAVVSFT